MNQYLELLEDVLKNGVKKTDRTGTGTLSVFARQLRFDLSKGFPLVTTKKTPFSLIASELLWFVKGDTNIRYLLQNNNNIWNEWAFKKWIESSEYTGPDMSNFGLRAQTDKEFNKVYKETMEIFKEKILTDDEFAMKFGDLGNVYGKQWREWVTSVGETIDQLNDVIEEIKRNPDSRRLLVSAWNPEDVPKNMALPPCHYAYQLYVSDGKLSLMWQQRSVDCFLGLPFNIASYALLTHLIAHQCDLEVGELVFTGGDVHIYSNHIEQVKLQLTREPKQLPTLSIVGKPDSLFEYELEDIAVLNYDAHPHIKGDVAV